jgi:hypothetical protein
MPARSAAASRHGIHHAAVASVANTETVLRKGLAEPYGLLIGGIFFADLAASENGNAPDLKAS